VREHRPRGITITNPNRRTFVTQDQDNPSGQPPDAPRSFNPDDPRCTKCGRTLAELGGPYSGLGGKTDKRDGSPDEVLCIDCMTPEQRAFHVLAIDTTDEEVTFGDFEVERIEFDDEGGDA
jgi:hypothetical protein